MQLTTLHAENVLSFSSFDLEFDDGLNVIVGPNGAGKSNVIRLVALIRTALDFAVSPSQTSIDILQYSRIGAPPHSPGVVSLGVKLTEDSEKSLVLSFVRALVASSMPRNLEASPSVDCAHEQQAAAHVRSRVTMETVDSLLCGRLVLRLERWPSASLGLAYEFDYRDTTYHYGLIGSGVPAQWVVPGLFAQSPLLYSWRGQPLDLSSFLDGTTPDLFSFGNLLPEADQMVPWEVQNHPSGPRLLLSEELARSLDIPDRQRVLSLGLVLHQALRDRLILTENVRRPPRTIYELSEVSPPVALDDAGDLPLELYRRSIGQTPEDRKAFVAVQGLFKELTGHELHITATIQTVPSTQAPTFMLQQSEPTHAPSLEFRQVHGLPEYQLHIQPVVPIDGGQVPVELAGAGVWEALVACTLAVPRVGHVVLLDEPAVNIHPTWQRQLLRHLARLDQAILVTHSPYLVPGDKVDDLSRIIRLSMGAKGTISAHLRQTSISDEWQHRWRQILIGSAEARGALFTRGVVLLEGDTELGAFAHWFSSELIVQERAKTHDALNLQLLVVGSDKSFGPYVSYLNMFHIPWVIICDGPVLSPEHEVSLLSQLTDARVHLGVRPDSSAPFEHWKAFWEMHNVFTVANQFGGVRNDRDKSGEIESFFARINPIFWEEMCQHYPKSKVRSGYAFAEKINLNDHPEQLHELQRLWKKITGSIEEQWMKETRVDEAEEITAVDKPAIGALERGEPMT